MTGASIRLVRSALSALLSQATSVAGLPELLYALGRDLSHLELHLGELRYATSVWQGFAEQVTAQGCVALPALANQARHLQRQLDRLQTHHDTLAHWRSALGRLIAGNSGNSACTGHCQRLLDQLTALTRILQALLNTLANLHAELAALRRLESATLSLNLSLLIPLLIRQLEAFRAQLY